VGVIYDPYMNRMCLAEKGKGATLNGKPIRVNSNSGFKSSVFGSDGPPHGLIPINDIFKALTAKGSHVLTLRCICYAGMLVSLGEFSAALTTGTTPWDGAALAILVTEAGGRITDLYGNPQRYDRDIKGFLVSNGLIHDEVIEILSGLLPKA
jgi:fructose-1,6-bisphosphatase/inositol monophosphatase family enzyme